jgi:hypothetical protein
LGAKSITITSWEIYDAYNGWSTDSF